MPNKAIDSEARKRQGARLAKIREWLGLTQEELAEWITGSRTGKSTISTAELGARPLPMKRLTELLGVSYDWLMENDDEEMWGPAVQQIRRRLALWLDQLPPEENDLLMHAGARIATSFREVQKFSHLLSDRYGAAILNIGLPQWMEVLNDETFVSLEQAHRWAEWTGLPETWLLQGELPPQPTECEQFEDYVPVFREARRVGISPEKLLAMIQVYGQ